MRLLFSQKRDKREHAGFCIICRGNVGLPVTDSDTSQTAFTTDAEESGFHVSISTAMSLAIYCLVLNSVGV